MNGQGILYVAEGTTIRKIDLSGNVTTVVDQRLGTAQLDTPQGLAIDAQGNIFITDGLLVMKGGDDVIRMLDPAGNVTTVAGSGESGSRDGPAATAQFNAPWGVAVDTQGRLYIGDTGNNRIRVISP